MTDITIGSTVTVKTALKKLDLCATKVLFLVDNENVLIGAISDGDIRRYILAGGDLEKTVEAIYNRSPYYVKEGCYTRETLMETFTVRKIEVIPVVNEIRQLKEFITWDSFMSGKPLHSKALNSALKSVPVVIMAGGKGTRLKPFTDVLPKPLVPIQEKPIMDWIIEEFTKCGARRFYATLNYRGKMIEAYYGSIKKQYTMEFKWEKDFFGTAGSLKLLSDEIDDTFIVTNCDIIVKADYGDVMQFHKDSGAAMTVVSSIQHHQIPYGVIEFGEGGVISSIVEKPEYTHVINTGVYLLERECLDFIPDNSFFHLTHLIEKVIASGKKVVTYPVNEKEYVDIGQWEEYMSAVDNFRF